MCWWDGHVDFDVNDQGWRHCVVMKGEQFPADLVLLASSSRWILLLVLKSVFLFKNNDSLLKLFQVSFCFDLTTFSATENALWWQLTWMEKQTWNHYLPQSRKFLLSCRKFLCAVYCILFRIILHHSFFYAGPIKSEKTSLHQGDTRVLNSRAPCQFECSGLPFLLCSGPAIFICMLYCLWNIWKEMHNILIWI